MSLRSLALVLACFAVGCGGSRPSSKEPTTAKEKQIREAKAKGESDEPQKAGKKWTGWKYQGDRDDCFFVIGRRCFKTQDAACKAAKCVAPKSCHVEGGGPASVLCK